MVPRAGLEPAQEFPLPPQDSVSTNSTTSARKEVYAKQRRLASFFLRFSEIFSSVRMGPGLFPVSREKGFSLCGRYVWLEWVGAAFLAMGGEEKPVCFGY